MQLKIGTYNIQHGVLHQTYLNSKERVADLSAVTAVLQANAPDICAINEIYGDGDFGNQPKALGDALSMRSAFTHAIDHRYGKYGNALLSRFPIHSVTRVPLCIPMKDRNEGTKYEDRVLLIADLLVADKPLTVMVCHFGLAEDEQALAVDTIIDEASRITAPAVLMGDFNLTPDSPLYARLAEVFEDSAALTSDSLLTFPSHAPDCKIDYVFTKGNIKATRVIAPAVVASDHLPLFVEVTL